LPLWKSYGTCGHKKKNNCSCPIKCPFPFKYCPFLAVEWFFTHIKNLYQKWHTHPEISQNRTDLTHCRVLYLEDDSGNYILYLLQHEQVFVRKLNHIEKNWKMKLTLLWYCWMERKRLGKGKLPSITPTDMPLYILYVKKDSKDFIYFYNGKRLSFQARRKFSV